LRGFLISFPAAACAATLSSGTFLLDELAEAAAVVCEELA
jgi:hypothetical protein